MDDNIEPCLEIILASGCDGGWNVLAVICDWRLEGIAVGNQVGVDEEIRSPICMEMDMAAPWRRIETVFFRFGHDAGRGQTRIAGTRTTRGWTWGQHPGMRHCTQPIETGSPGRYVGGPDTRSGVSAGNVSGVVRSVSRGQSRGSCRAGTAMLWAPHHTSRFVRLYSTRTILPISNWR